MVLTLEIGMRSRGQVFHEMSSTIGHDDGRLGRRRSETETIPRRQIARRGVLLLQQFLSAVLVSSRHGTPVFHRPNRNGGGGDERRIFVFPDAAQGIDLQGLPVGRVRELDFAIAQYVLEDRA